VARDEGSTGNGSRLRGAGAPGDGSPGGSSRPGFEALHDLRRELGEIFEHFSHLLSAKYDSAALSVRKKVLWAALGLLGLFAGLGVAATLGVTLTLFLFRGLAGGLGALFAGRTWLGELVLGALFFAGLAVFLVMGLRKLKRASLKKLVEKYESRKRRQREKYGRTVEDQARARGQS